MTLREVLKVLETKNVQEELEMSGEQILEQLKRKGILFENIYQELEMTSLYVDTHEDVSYAEDVVQLHSHSFWLHFLEARS